MATAGYSGTSLIKKLGIKPDMKILIINKPDDYYKLLKVDITDQSCKSNEVTDFIHLFVKSVKEFESEMKALKSVYKKIQLLSFGYRGIRKLQRSQLILLKM